MCGGPWHWWQVDAIRSADLLEAVVLSADSTNICMRGCTVIRQHIRMDRSFTPADLEGRKKRRAIAGPLRNSGLITDDTGGFPHELLNVFEQPFEAYPIEGTEPFVAASRPTVSDDDVTKAAEFIVQLVSKKADEAPPARQARGSTGSRMPIRDERRASGPPG